SAYDHAASCFRDALSVSEEADRLLPLQRWAQAQAYAGRPLDAARTFESAARASGADFDAEVRQAAVHYLLAGDLDRGLALTRRSFRRLGERLPRSRLQIYARLIWLRWQRTSLARTTSTAVSRKRHIEIAD